MNRQYLIGIDLGSTFAKATLFDAEGRAVSDARRDNLPNQPRAGTAEYDALKMLRATLGAVKEVLNKRRINPADVIAVCADGMISGTMGIDADGEATTPYTTTLDMRFAPQLNQVMDRWHDLIRQKTGSGQPTVGPKMMWVRDEFPDVYRRTAKFVTITSYVAGKLAGLRAAEAFIDATHLWATGLSDTPRYAWSKDLCQAMRLPMSKLPRIVSATTVVGKVCRVAARQSGLKQGTPVVAGAGDQSAAFVGAGLTRPGRMGDAAGTFPILSLCTDQFRPDLKHRMAEIMPSPVEGLWNPCSIIIGGGLTHRWAGELFTKTRRGRKSSAKKSHNLFAALEKKAARVPPGSAKLLFNPHLGGQACPTRTYVKGTWSGFTWTHKTEHLYRAVLESIAYDQFLAFQAMKSSYPEVQPKEIIVYAGGARSRLWNQIKADVMGLPYVGCQREDLAALGAAIIAGCAVGLYPDMAAAAEQFARRGGRYKPSPKRHEFYRAYAAAYGRWLEQTDAAARAISQLPEWPDTK